MTYKDVEEIVSLALALNDEDNRLSVDAIAYHVYKFYKEFLKEKTND